MRKVANLKKLNSLKKLQMYKFENRVKTKFWKQTGSGIGTKSEHVRAGLHFTLNSKLTLQRQIILLLFSYV